MMLAEQLEQFVRQTSEGVHFLDYLECLAYEDMTTGDLGYFLKDHKQGVIDAQSEIRVLVDRPTRDGDRYRAAEARQSKPRRRPWQSGAPSGAPSYLG